MSQTQSVRPYRFAQVRPY